MIELRMKSQEQYTAEHGEFCPRCGSNQITGGPVDLCDGAAFQDSHCADCDLGWTDVYTLTAYFLHKD